MRSLHVITSTARRGAETFAVQLVEQLRSSHGHDADVVALSAAEGDTFDVEVLGTHRRSPGLLRELRQRAADVDVVVGHGSSTLEACGLSLLGTTTPFVFRSIGDPGYWLRTRTKRRVVSWFMQRADQHVALWQGAREQLTNLHRIDPARIHVIPNGVDGRRFPPASADDRRHARRSFAIDETTPVLAVVGALSEEKNPDAIIETARTIPEAKLLVVGDGPARRRMDAAAKELTNLQLLGTLSDPYPVYACADALLLPSLSEGMPAVIIEAGMVGRPTIATPVGAVPEMLADGRGVVISSTAPETVARRCRSALEDLPAVSAEHWNRYGIVSLAAAWTSVLEGITADTSHR